MQARILEDQPALTSITLQENKRQALCIHAKENLGLTIIGFDFGKIIVFDNETFNPQFELNHPSHQGVRAIISIDDHRIAAASGNNICIWNLKTHLCEKNLEGHTDSVNALLLSQHQELVSASFDKSIRFWNIQTGKCRSKIESYNFAEHFALSNFFMNVAIYFNHLRSAVSWVTGYLLLKEYTDSVVTLTNLSNGNIACGSSEGMIAIIDSKTGNCKFEIEVEKKRTGSMGWLGRSQRIEGIKELNNKFVSASTHKLHIYDQTTYICKRLINCEHKKEVSSFGLYKKFEDVTEEIDAIELIQHYLLTLSSERLRVWDSNTGNCIKTITNLNFIRNFTLLNQDTIVLLEFSIDVFKKIVSNKLHQLSFSHILQLTKDEISFAEMQEFAPRLQCQ